MSLAKARAAAADARALCQQGINPLDQRKASRAAAAAAAGKAMTFDQCAAAYIAANEDGWRHPRHVKLWRATLARYASPIFGKLVVSDVDRGLVLRALDPIWAIKPETASRVRGRIELILDFAEARGYRPEGSNPARLLPIKTALGRRPQKVQHFAALPYGELPAFMAELRPGARILDSVRLTHRRSVGRTVERDRSGRSDVGDSGEPDERQQGAPRALDRPGDRAAACPTA